MIYGPAIKTKRKSAQQRDHDHIVTGACGFVGSALPRALREGSSGIRIVGIHNLSRPGSEINRIPLQKLGMSAIHGDVRCASDFENSPDVA